MPNSQKKRSKSRHSRRSHSSRSRRSRRFRRSRRSHPGHSYYYPGYYISPYYHNFGYYPTYLWNWRWNAMIPELITEPPVMYQSQSQQPEPEPEPEPQPQHNDLIQSIQDMLPYLTAAAVALLYLKG